MPTAEAPTLAATTPASAPTVGAAAEARGATTTIVAAAAAVASAAAKRAPAVPVRSVLTALREGQPIISNYFLITYLGCCLFEES